MKPGTRRHELLIERDCTVAELEDQLKVLFDTRTLLMVIDQAGVRMYWREDV